MSNPQKKLIKFNNRFSKIALKKWRKIITTANVASSRTIHTTLSFDPESVTGFIDSNGLIYWSVTQLTPPQKNKKIKNKNKNPQKIKTFTTQLSSNAPAEKTISKPGILTKEGRKLTHKTFNTPAEKSSESLENGFLQQQRAVEAALPEASHGDPWKGTACRGKRSI